MSFFLSDTVEAGGSFPVATGSFSGSLTQVVPGVPFITAIGGTSISTGSMGQLVISSSVSAGNVSSLTGAGGTTVTNVGTAYTVSSSVTPPATNVALGTVQLAQDLSGAANGPTVVALRNVALLSQSMGVSTDLYFLEYIDHDKAWEAKQFKLTGGDVTGSYPSFVVQGIAGILLTGSAPNDGDSLKYSSSAARWIYSPGGSPATNTSQGLVRLAGDLTGSADTPLVAGITGVVTGNDFGGGNVVQIVPTETVMASTGSNLVRSFVQGATTTDGTTWVTIAQFAPSTSSLHDWSLSVAGVNTTFNGDFYRCDLNFTSVRSGSANPVYTPSAPAGSNVRSSGNGSTYATQVTGSAANTLVQVKGAGSTTVRWSATGVVRRVV